MNKTKDFYSQSFQKKQQTAEDHDLKRSNKSIIYRHLPKRSK